MGDYAVPIYGGMIDRPLGVATAERIGQSHLGQVQRVRRVNNKRKNVSLSNLRKVVKKLKRG